VESYSSGGVPAIEKLLSHGDYAVATSHKLSPIKVRTGFLEERDPSGTIATTPIRRGASSICSLQWVGNDLYVFRESEMRWRRANPVGLNITIDVDGETRTLDMNAVQGTYTQITVLN